MRYDLIIRHGSVVHADGVRAEDIAIAEGKFVEIAPEVRGDARETIDATGLHLFPGLIDSHVHFNEPGRTEWEGFATGSSALAAGGGTCFFDMPLNSSPPVLDGEAFDRKREAGEKSSVTDFGIWGGLTPRNLDRMEELAERGVVGFKAFMCDSGIAEFEHADDLTLYRGMQRAAKLNCLVAVHAESESLTAAMSRELIAGGNTSIDAYLESRPIVAEVDAIRRAVLFARETGCALHIVHTSSAAGSMEVVEAKHEYVTGEDRPVDVTCETCPHYLLLTDQDQHRLGACAKCAPPLRSQDEVRRLWAQLATGGIDFVASDHSPSPPSMKTGDDFFKIWGGISGVQSTLLAMISEGFHKREIPLSQVAKLTSTNVAQRYAIRNKGTIAVGFDADLAIVNVTACDELHREDLQDRHKLSPYVGRKFHGAVMRTILRGRTVFEDPNVVVNSGGHLIVPSPSGRGLG